jgi:hypothetical protein
MLTEVAKKAAEDAWWKDGTKERKQFGSTLSRKKRRMRIMPCKQKLGRTLPSIDEGERSGIAVESPARYHRQLPMEK